MAMELQQLRYFCSVVRYGSFTKAAEKEGIAQPTLSLQIRRLEKSVGSTLFVRLARSVRLTHPGEIFYSHAKEILSQSKLAESQVRQLEDGIRGPLRIGAIPTILPYLLAPHLPEFSTLYPEVDIILTEDVTTNLVDKLRAGDLDVIIVSLPLRQPDLVCSELLCEPLVLVAPKEHTLCRAKPAKLDLSGERLLLLKEGHCFRNDMLIACRRGSAEMAPVFESDHFGSIFPLVASGAGITIAPRMAAIQADGCTVMPLPKEQSRRIGYARLKSSARFKTLTAFTKVVANCTGIGRQVRCIETRNGRVLREQGHDVKLIPAQFVKPLVKSNTNDFLDAEAIDSYSPRNINGDIRVKNLDL